MVNWSCCRRHFLGRLNRLSTQQSESGKDTSISAWRSANDCLSDYNTCKLIIQRQRGWSDEAASDRVEFSHCTLRDHCTLTVTISVNITSKFFSVWLVVGGGGISVLRQRFGSSLGCLHPVRSISSSSWTRLSRRSTLPAPWSVRPGTPGTCRSEKSPDVAVRARPWSVRVCSSLRRPCLIMHASRGRSGDETNGGENCVKIGGRQQRAHRRTRRSCIIQTASRLWGWAKRPRPDGKEVARNSFSLWLVSVYCGPKVNYRAEPDLASTRWKPHGCHNKRSFKCLWDLWNVLVIIEKKVCKPLTEYVASMDSKLVTRKTCSPLCSRETFEISFQNFTSTLHFMS